MSKERPSGLAGDTTSGSGVSPSLSETAQLSWWGGVAGIAGALAAFLSIVVLPVPPASAQSTVATFPNIRTAWLVGDAVYLSAFVLFAILFLTLYFALRHAHFVPALIGAAFALLGVAFLAAGGMTGLVLNNISNLYHAPGTTLLDQATLALSWSAIDGVFTETDTVGGIFLSLGAVLLGVAMMRDPRTGVPLAVGTILIGLLALAGIAFVSIAQGNPDDPAFALLVVVLPLLLGWKLSRLSRLPSMVRSGD